MRKSTIENMLKNKPIRIAVVMGKHTTGGIKSVIMNYYRFIDRESIQFDFIVDSDSPIKDYSDIESLGGRVYEIPPIKNLLGYVVGLYKIIKENKYLVVHGYVNTLNVFPMFVAMLAGVPVRIAENLSTAHAGEGKTVIKNILKQFNMVFPTHLAANSFFSGEWIYGKDKMEKCQIIRNAIDLEKYKFDEPLRTKIREEYKWSDKFVIGHIGRYQYQKNHDFLIDIFYEIHKKCENAILVLVGYGDLKDQIFDKIKKLGLSDYVVDLGGTEDIAKFYNAMDCFVLPSFYEGLPVVGIEAQATGLPCVFSTEVTAETKLINSAVFLELNQGATAWAERILEVQKLTRVDVKEEISRNGYNIRNEANVLKDYYLSCIEEACND